MEKENFLSNPLKKQKVISSKDGIKDLKCSCSENSNPNQKLNISKMCKEGSLNLINKSHKMVEETSAEGSKKEKDSNNCALFITTQSYQGQDKLTQVQEVVEREGYFGKDHELVSLEDTQQGHRKCGKYYLIAWIIEKCGGLWCTKFKLLCQEYKPGTTDCSQGRLFHLLLLDREAEEMDEGISSRKFTEGTIIVIQQPGVTAWGDFLCVTSYESITAYVQSHAIIENCKFYLETLPSHKERALYFYLKLAGIQILHLAKKERTTKGFLAKLKHFGVIKSLRRCWEATIPLGSFSTQQLTQYVQTRKNRSNNTNSDVVIVARFRELLVSLQTCFLGKEKHKRAVMGFEEWGPGALQGSQFRTVVYDRLADAFCVLVNSKVIVEGSIISFINASVVPDPKFYPDPKVKVIPYMLETGGVPDKQSIVLIQGSENEDSDFERVTFGTKEVDNGRGGNAPEG